MPIDRAAAGRVVAGRVIAGALLMAVTGCAAGQNDLAKSLGADPSWGEANRQTMAAQIIDPAPQYDTAVPEGSGDHTAAALERYRTDKVKKPDRQITSATFGSPGK